MAIAILTGCDEEVNNDSHGGSNSYFEKYGQEFKGKIAKSYEESEE